MKNKLNKLKLYNSKDEKDLRKKYVQLYNKSPLSNDQKLNNLGLYLDSKSLSRILFMDFLYRKIIDTQGVIMEFGTHWGQNCALFSSLRGIYEPYNRHRKIIGFDTFKGFPSINKKDGNSDLMKKNKLSLPKNYSSYLKEILNINEKLNPLSHINKNEIFIGDAPKKLKSYIDKQKHTIISLAYFDLDLYKPTKKCLEIIKNRVTKGTIFAFDELNDPDSPGETLALMEVLGLKNIKLKRYRYCSRVSYFEL